MADEKLCAERLYGELEVFQLRGVPRRTLQKLRMSGGGPGYVKIGRRIYYRLSAVDSWISKNTRQSTADKIEDDK